MGQRTLMTLHTCFSATEVLKLIHILVYIHRLISSVAHIYGIGQDKDSHNDLGQEFESIHIETANDSSCMKPQQCPFTGEVSEDKKDKDEEKREKYTQHWRTVY